MRRIPFLFLIIFVPTLVLANGSPINTGETLRTGNIRMIQKKDIRLLSETVSVRLSGDYADVRVSYSFHNTGPADKVTYGFPVECAPYTGEEYAPKEEALTDFRIEVQNDFDFSRRQLRECQIFCVNPFFAFKHALPNGRQN
jgi:hypothetical protein